MIIKGTDSTNTKITLSIDNGDLQGLKEVIEKFNFIDEQAALRFALFALLNAEKNVLYVDKGQGKISLTPSQQSIKPHTNNEQENS